jgi:hypothetical protein
MRSESDVERKIHIPAQQAWEYIEEQLKVLQEECECDLME